MSKKSLLALLLLAIAAAAPPARAAVTFGSSAIEVEGPAGAVGIERAPFRMTFSDRAGRRVLSELPASSSLPVAVPPLPQPLPGVPAAPDAPAAYAPLSFLVGLDQPIAEPAGQYEGDLVSNPESGVRYFAQGVVGAQPDGAGVRLTLATNDPSGRHLVVTVEPDGPDAFRVSAAPDDPSGVAGMSDSFGSTGGEAFHGFGGRHNAIDEHGQDFYNWLDQENTGAGSGQAAVNATQGQAGDTYLFPSGPEAAYYVQSSFVSNRGYGFLLDRSELSHWRLDSDRPDAWQTEVAAPAIDYVVAPGSMTHAAATLTSLTGRQRVPPKWAAGTAFDREVAYPPEPAATYLAQVESDLQNIARYHLPLDAYRIEGWQFLTHAQLESVIGELHRRGIHALLYFRAFVGQDAIGTDDPSDYDTATRSGYVATTAAGQPYVFISNFNAPAALLDFTNPSTVSWWRGRIEAALDTGADGFMLDFGEQTQPDMRFHDGSTGAQMHNRYPILYEQATRAAVDAYARRNPGRRPFFFTRSGYTGTPGSAAYENANFPGDETTDWSRSSGLASLASDMLNRAIGGAFGYDTDIGGYFDLGPYQPTTKELFVRWAEWAALTPIFRLHGSVSAGVHAPWTFDQQTVSLYNALSRLHLSARPLILRLWGLAVATGAPITRPLYLAYPGDPQAARQDEEWLLGPDVLVAPVVTEGASSRSVYFPAGCWRSPASGQQVRGPRPETIAAGLGQLPFFFRCGTRPFTPPGSFGSALIRRKSCRACARHRRRSSADRPRFTG